MFFFFFFFFVFVHYRMCVRRACYFLRVVCVLLAARTHCARGIMNWSTSQLFVCPGSGHTLLCSILFFYHDGIQYVCVFVTRTVRAKHEVLWGACSCAYDCTMHGLYITRV